jgi:hypothetical protein
MDEALSPKLGLLTTVRPRIQLSEPVNSPLLHAGQHVRVRVQSQRDLGVTEHLLEKLEVDLPIANAVRSCT